MTDRLIYRDADSGITFSDQGGPYIDMSWTTGDDVNPFNTLNVWDYAAGTRSIPFTRDALETAAREWLADTGAEEVQRYRDNT